MRRITKFSLLLSLVLGLYFPTVFAQSNMTNEMFDLAKLKSGVKNKRISSTDPTGGNRDHLEPFKPGEKRIIADIKGTGVINHIWVTIAPPPPTLSRNDIIIRMYWDGNDYPSVESPIGPFFGQGWDERYNYASLPLSAGPENGTGLSCYFAMPFEKGARIEIENQSDRNIDAFYFYVDYLKHFPKARRSGELPVPRSRTPPANATMCSWKPKARDTL